MKGYKFGIVLYRIMLINLSIIICLLFSSILYNYVLINIDVSNLHIKESVVSLFRWTVSTGVFLILLSFVLYKLFSMVYYIAEGNLLECLRQELLSPYQISSREASLQIKSGRSVYAESYERGIFFKISYRNGKAIIDRLSNGLKTEMECREISMYDLEELTDRDGVSFYRSEAYDEMLDSGFTIVDSR